MPELPEVETIVRGLRACTVGRSVTGVQVLRQDVIRGYTPEFEEALTGRKVEEVLRRGKNIIIKLAGGPAMVVHLKMTGQFTCNRPEEEILKHTHLLINLSDGGQLRFRDIRRFGYVILVKPDLLAELPQLAAMGPEPLEITFESFACRFRGRRQRIKAMLLNQRVLAGLGNIYADEALHRAGIHPETPANQLSERNLRHLFEAVREVLSEAIARRGSSVENYVDAGGAAGTFQLYHRVYRKRGQPCPLCGTPIERITVGGRGTHFCPKCQKRSAGS
ncbi:MAG: bifunctional DNA-formamidopyrimidine glycosylase/DNA-(apurinic or apyrimidinic site) lyase [bacterium]|jgi:formamidopyrimidine-DNA glycosylase|nr:bifunctional DNA-formamidopyrimidine glycosylase/DNA-(apurinic or apyrimidinic site) lyase [bacterium]